MIPKIEIYIRYLKILMKNHYFWNHIIGQMAVHFGKKEQIHQKLVKNYLNHLNPKIYL
jgi:hypothetical protein